jgi:hypothetical protein
MDQRMSNNNFRNTELLGKLERHPLKKALARALDAAEIFAGDAEYISLNDGLSPKGRDDARRSKLRAAVRDNRDARGPLNEMKTTLDKKRKAVTLPPLDPADVVGFLRRQELRATLRTMDAGQRALLLSGAGSDPAFVDAMLEQPPLLSGLLPGEDFIVTAAKEQRLGSLYGPQLAEIEELETTIAEANGIFDLALVDLKLHSEMDDRTFAEFTAPIMARKNAPWLKRDKDINGNEVIRVFDPKNHAAFPIASADQRSDGVFFKDFAEYEASRAAA